MTKMLILSMFQSLRFQLNIFALTKIFQLVCDEIGLYQIWNKYKYKLSDF